MESSERSKTMKVSRKLVVGAVAGLAVVGAGAAVAATQFGDPKSESEAIIKDAAGQLGVQPGALSDALKKAMENRIDAAVAAGRLSKEQGDAIKKQIDAGGPLLVPGGFRGGFGPMGGPRGPMGPMGPMGAPGHMGGLDAAAQYLGLSESDLMTKLQSGKSLADVAKDQGKSVDGLVDAMVADAKTHIDQAVKDGHLTQAQADQILSQIKSHITDLVNGTAPQGFGPAFRSGGSGPPGFPGPGGLPSLRKSGMGMGWGASA
jgi:polyhydroxyalkanoate synthesis regulator phasin